MQIISLDQVPLEELVAAFNDAFTDYAVTVEMTAARLKNLIIARSVRLDLSSGIMAGERLKAFVLTGSRRIEDLPTAYNAATGVRCAYQRQGLGKRLLSHTMALLEAAGYRRYLLEVITTNTAAIGLYTDQGFAERRLLNCYSALPSEASTDGLAPGTGAAVTPLGPEWALRMGPLLSQRPSWQNAATAVNAIARHCRLIFAGTLASPAAMAVLDPRTGSIHQFGFAAGAADAARQVMVRALQLSATDTVHLANVDAGDGRMNAFLQEAGFARPISQLEMEYCWL